MYVYPLLVKVVWHPIPDLFIPEYLLPAFVHDNVNFLRIYSNKTFRMGKVSPYVSTLLGSEGDEVTTYR